MARRLRQVKESLKAAAELGDIDGLYRSIKEVPVVLDRIDAMPFVETPLHAAASAGQIIFAKEILRLKPSFGRKLNPDGLSSLHLALINHQFDMVQALVQLDKELIRLKGKEGESPLHFIVKKENTDDVNGDEEQGVEGRVSGSQQQREDLHILQQQREDLRIHKLAEFLLACPDSIEDRTIRDETALHVAVKSRNKRAVEVILGFIHKVDKTRVLAATDYQGNTALHVAVSSSQPEMVKLLVKGCSYFCQVKGFSRKDINKKNDVTKKTALDIALSLGTHEGSSIAKHLRCARALKGSSSAKDYSLAEFFRSPLNRFEKGYKDRFFRQRRSGATELRNFGLVIAVLIATATFQAISNPPGGQGGGRNLLTNGGNVNATVSSTNNLFAANTSSNINATFISISTDVPVESSSSPLFLFYWWNSFAFLLSALIISAYFPFRPNSLLQASLVFLMLTYLQSLQLNAPRSHYNAVFYAYSWVVLVVYICRFLWHRIKVCVGEECIMRKRFGMLRGLLRNCVDGQKFE